MPSSVADVQAMLDDIYGVMGVPATWTAAGGGAVSLTALPLGGDDGAHFKGAVAEMNVAQRILRVRVAEVACATSAQPLSGDAVTTPDGAFVITGDPRHPAGDHRRLEWEFDLADA